MSGQMTEAERTLAHAEERWLLEVPAVDQKTRADHIAWLRTLTRVYPRGPLRTDARRRRRAVIRQFRKVHMANRPWTTDLRIILCTMPASLLAGAALYTLVPR